MSSYAERLAIELRNAYEAHDRDAHERALRRMVQGMAYAGPVDASGIVKSDTRNCTMPDHLGCQCESDAQRSTCMYRGITR